ncbi:MAG: hydrogenase 3 maturation endopeptidase HyCI [Candidatus Omnitrophica bacterium CG_4_9_14_0_2_um_filter_43_12]|nr:MAG: hydrogenase 3 maturation endopeptidase HyCI [Candidatus Omnitrophica bacterium CG03_land_8_20_14_0_80_43_22]PJC46049.1 MAG: hydrogenase 3 maturation endopeptidase HyCI [Candidatus Omnitrophica bacterium CG_4_9_14_0_2_um_filter_43_12]
MKKNIKNKISRIVKKGGVVFMGVGNPLRSDDYAGLYVISKLKGDIFIDAGQMPENYTGRIAKIKPRKVLIVDAVDFKAAPGEIGIFDASQAGEFNFSTHGMSLGLFSSQLKQYGVESVLLVGIQPQSLEIKENTLSAVVKKTADELIEILKGGV